MSGRREPSWDQWGHRLLLGQEARALRITAGCTKVADDLQGARIGVRVEEEGWQERMRQKKQKL